MLSDYCSMTEHDLSIPSALPYTHHCYFSPQPHTNTLSNSLYQSHALIYSDNRPTTHLGTCSP